MQCEAGKSRNAERLKGKRSLYFRAIGEELTFPFGLHSGKQAVAHFVQGLQGQLTSLQHYPDEYTYIAAGDSVVVEGWESGEMNDGTHWPAPGHTDGRFCNVFRFRDNLISQVHIYVDLDFTGQDEPRFYWGKRT